MLIISNKNKNAQNVRKTSETDALNKKKIIVWLREGKNFNGC